MTIILILGVICLFGYFYLKDQKMKDLEEAQLAARIKAADEDAVRCLKANPNDPLLYLIQAEISNLANYLSVTCGPHEEEYPELECASVVGIASTMISDGEVSEALRCLAQTRENIKKAPRPWPEFIRDAVKAIGETESGIYTRLPAETAETISSYVMSRTSRDLKAD